MTSWTWDIGYLLRGVEEHVKYAVVDFLKGFPGGSVVKNPPANAGDTVPSLIQEDPSYCGAIESVLRNYYWACALEPGSHSYGSPHALEPVVPSKGSHCNEKLAHQDERVVPAHRREEPSQQWRPSTARNK